MTLTFHFSIVENKWLRFLKRNRQYKSNESTNIFQQDNP